jgi:predicted metalloprotease
VKLGLGAIVLAFIASLILGVNPMTLIGGLMAGKEVINQVAPPQAAPAKPAQPGQLDQSQEMIARVLGDTEDVWGALFKALNAPPYQKPGLVFFNGQVQSACGFASAAVGPFYCPSDRRVFLDTAFFHELANRFRAPGDFAQAYVVAHEVGHHVQNLQGIMAQLGPRPSNAAQIRLELQADCYAGVWGYFAAKRNLLEAGDLEEGLRAASAVGDDQIQRRTQGYVVPDAFTHGSAQQRMFWFRRGLETGDPRACDTFTQTQP